MQKQQSGMFRGDADELVDRLVEACANSKQTSPLANPAWIGRELQPFAFDDELPAAPAKQASSKGSQPQSPGCQLNASGSSSNNKRKGASHSPSKPRGRASLDGAAKRDVHAQASAKQRCMRQGPSQQQALCMLRPSTAGSAATAAPSSPIPCPQPPRAHPNAHASPSGSPPAGFACPAMFSSPKPEALPMPTSRLLMRAAYAGCGPAIALPTCAVLA